MYSNKIKQNKYQPLYSISRKLFCRQEEKEPSDGKRLSLQQISQTTWNTSKGEHLFDAIITKHLGETSNVKDTGKDRLQRGNQSKK
jgi:hypothetical protein